MSDPNTDPQGRPIVDPDAATPIKGDGGDPPAASPAPSPPPAAPRSALRETVATWMAVSIILALGGFYAYLILCMIDAEVMHWERAMILLSGVEAIVFAAAGFLFGTTVQRQVSKEQVQSEKNQADAAKKDAKRENMRADREAANASAARDKAIKGEMLATAVVAKAQTDPDGSPEFGKMGGEDKRVAPGARDIGDLLALARKVQE